MWGGVGGVGVGAGAGGVGGVGRCSEMTFLGGSQMIPLPGGGVGALLRESRKLLMFRGVALPL